MRSRSSGYPDTLDGYGSAPDLIRGYNSKLTTGRSRPIDFELNIEYFKNSLAVDSSEMQQICQCAAENKVVVCMGFSERYLGSVYIAQCIINSDGALLMTRRKLKPVHMERTIFGDGDGPSLLNVVQTSTGRVGALSCGVRIVNFESAIN